MAKQNWSSNLILMQLARLPGRTDEGKSHYTGVHVERVRYFTWFTVCATQCLLKALCVASVPLYFWTLNAVLLSGPTKKYISCRKT